ncbi:DUF975 family protein [Pontiella agarivorans]|uniref:DUF975 family protein n=1 Tax=Pontiella agarivorans TaxID=3038953 RepID=A0ABU5MSF4_9BACT|nr:DUF975 family protein [Pontiella agarivorans]MDZ8117132.1 DUF975 family protein [Pontiella agarivorans]
MTGLNDDGGVPKISIPSTGGAPSGGVSGGGVTPNGDLTAEARESLRGNWGMAVLGYVLYTALSFAISFFVIAATIFVGAVAGLGGGDAEAAGTMISGVAQLFQLFVMPPVMVGFFAYYLGLAQEDEARLELLFAGFKRFWKSLGVYFFYMLFIYLWMLLLIIPGIIKCFSYSQAFFIIADDEGCGPLEAISRSKEMMAGNKWKFFCLNLRFIGWSLLALLTLGIGYLWLVPYMQTSLAKFYEDVK